MTQLKPLQSAYCTQQQGGDEPRWQVLNQAAEVLAFLPRELSASGAMDFLEFARPFELSAYQAGLIEGKRLNDDGMKNIKADYDIKLKLLSQENERLADILDKHLTEE
jgi:hypothetical protein